MNLAGEPPRSEASSSQTYGEPPLAIGNINVLIVEDDFYQQSVLRTLFDKANEVNEGVVHVDITIASTGAEAMEMLNGPTPFNFDVVLLDVALPDNVDGTEILKGIRALPNGDRIGVVMASAFAQVPIVTRCMTLGANAYLQKPILLQSIKLIWQYCFRAHPANANVAVDKVIKQYLAPAMAPAGTPMPPMMPPPPSATQAEATAPAPEADAAHRSKPSPQPSPPLVPAEADALPGLQRLQPQLTGTPPVSGEAGQSPPFPRSDLEGEDTGACRQQ